MHMRATDMREIRVAAEESHERLRHFAHSIVCMLSGHQIIETYRMCDGRRHLECFRCFTSDEEN